MSAPDMVLEAINISKRFPGVQALKEVSIRLYKGRVMALLGENGAGKSTLMSVLAGVCRPDTGEVRLQGQRAEMHSARDAKALGIAVIFQELSLVGNLSIAENLYLGREPRNSVGLIDYPKLNRNAKQLLERMNLTFPPETLVSSLRVGQQQAIEIARGASSEARVLILDEPTSSLSAQEAEALFNVIKGLKQSGVAIIYITHKLEELVKVADELTIMRDGQVVASSLPVTTSHDEIVRAMVGRELGAFRASRKPPEVAIALQADGICLPHPTRKNDFLVKNVSLSVAKGEVLGLFGLVGAGRTELLETLYGAHSGRSQGRVSLEGQPVSIQSPADAIRLGFGLAPEDRKQAGLLLRMSVRSNASLATLRSIVQWGLLQGSRESERVMPSLQQMRLRTDAAGVEVINLSGGNQQKVVLAKWLATHPKVLLLDEPTRGVDVHAKQEMYNLIDELANRGLAVLLASSDISEILALSNRVLVMSEGEVTKEMNVREATPEALLSAALPKRQRAVGT